MRKRRLAALLIAVTLLSAMGTIALANPGATASPEASSQPATTAATAQPEETATASQPDASATATQPEDTATASATDDITIKLGDEGDNVILLQLRLQDLGYYNYKITGFFGDFTEQAVADFQKTNGIDDDGIAGAKTLDALYSNDAKRKPVEPISIKPSTTIRKPAKVKYGKIMDWSVANQKWTIGMKCKVIDLDTGISYYMIRCNRSYSVGHADVAPATKADTAALKKTFDGDFTAYRRALIVNIDGQWIAASIYGQPHGSTGVPGNGLNLSDGTLQQVCIHFRNSWTNCRGLIDDAHQYQILRAANQKPTGPRPVLVYPGD